MNRFNWMGLLSAVAAVGASLSVVSSAQAATTNGRWNYAIDSFTDSSGDVTVRNANGTSSTFYGRGGSDYEIYGMAYRQIGDEIFFAINANAGPEGNYYSGANDKNIGWGDLMLTFGNGKQFGVNFATLNDSGTATGGLTDVKESYQEWDSKKKVFVTKTRTVKKDLSGLANGVYSNITTKDTTAVNAGWSKYSDFIKGETVTVIDPKTKKAKNVVTQRQNTFGTLDPTKLASFSKDRSATTNIATGNLVGGISRVSEEALKALGLNFGNGLALDAAARGIADRKDASLEEWSALADGKYAANLKQDEVNTKNLGSKTFGFSFKKTADMAGDFIASLFFECTNDGIGIDGKVSETKVPEPSTLGAIGLVGLLAAARKRRAAKA